MHVIGYARISIKDQSTYSIPGQVGQIAEYCTRHGLTLHRTFIDEGQSAFNFNRKEWRELEACLKTHPEVRAIVVLSLDRFSRADLADALAKMNQIQRRLGVKILTVTDNVDLDIEDFGTDIRRVIELLFSNYELKKIRKRTSDGMYNAMQQGRYMNKAPVGYMNGRDAAGKPVLLIDDTKAPEVRAIFASLLRGQGITEISAMYKARRGNSAIKRILTNPVYAGYVQLPRHGKFPPRLIKGLHPALVSEGDYWAVQEKLGSRVRKSQHREEVYLSGVLCCPECGRGMSTDKSRGKSGRYYRYYICKPCRVRQPAAALHTAMDAVLRAIRLPDASVERIRVAVAAAIEQRMRSKGGDLMRANSALQAVQARIAAAEEKYLLAPDISPATYKKIVTELRAEESRWQAATAALATSESSYYKMLDLLLPRLQRLDQEFREWPLYRQQSFLRLVFGPGLSFEKGCFRTPGLHTLFADFETVLKEKGLMTVSKAPFVAPAGVQPNTFDLIEQLWAAVS